MVFPENDCVGRDPFEFQLQKSVFSEEFGRESLGILDLNNEDFGRESLASFDLGRESLGIVNLNTIDVERESLDITAINFDELPPIFISDVTGNTTTYSELNKGFITSKQLKSGSTFSSLGSLFSSSTHFSIASVPSTISLGLQIDESTHNDAFRVPPNYATRSCLVPPSATNDNKNTRRICSAPGDLEREDEIPSLQTCDTQFDDAVFIEGFHLASKIGDGSFYELGPEEVDHNLESIQAPENFIVVSDSESIGETETTAIINTVNRPMKNVFFTPTLPEVADLENLSKTSSETSSKTKSPLEALQSLSNILSQDEFTDEQKLEGKLLINSLAELILANRDTPSIINDSGHSSIEEQPLNLVSEEKCYKISNLQQRISNKQSENQLPLDLSLKSTEPNKVFVSPKILPRKFNMSQLKNYSVSSNESSDSGRFKIRKAEPQKLVKGPMRATIQLDQTGKDNGSLIVPKQKSRKTTSTPIRSYALPKPVAHSTPDNPSFSNKPKTDSPRLSKEKINYSSSNSLNKLQSDFKRTIKKPEIKRRSFSDLRTTESNRVKLTRSYSMGEKPIVTKTSRVIPTKIFRKSEELKKNKETVLKENVRPRSGESAMAGGKKLGKENVKRFNI